MDLLDVPLPELRLRLDIAPSVFFDRCEAIGRVQDWRIDRRHSYAGPGYDQLNLYIGSAMKRYPMLRMVSTPKEKFLLSLDVVALWESWPCSYDEYLELARRSYERLLTAYAEAHGKRYRLSVPRRPESLDLQNIDCDKIGYAAEKFADVRRSLALGKGDARARLIGAFATFHVIRPSDLPMPLRKHLVWVYGQITKRPARHRLEEIVEATVSTMKTATAATILERLIDLADAIDVLEEVCRGRR